MAESVAAITMVNMALVHLGQPAITTLDEAPAAAQMYPHVRDKMLSWGRWSFATTRQSLSRLSAAPASGYSYQYAVPTQPFCLYEIEANTKLDWTKEVYIDPTTGGEQAVILTDASSFVLRYIARVSEAIWPPLVFDTCAVWLALSISQAVTGRDALRKQLFEELSAQMERCLLLDGNKRQPRRLTLNETYMATRESEAMPRVDPTLPQPT